MVGGLLAGGGARLLEAAAGGDIGFVAEDWVDAGVFASLVELEGAVKVAVVGEGQGLQAQPGRLLGQLLGVGGPVQEAEVGVAVQLGVGHGARPPFAGGRRYPTRASS